MDISGNSLEGYSKNDYGTLFYSLIKIYKPLEIVEIGVGDSYTLDAIVRAVKENNVGRVRVYDIFEEWKYFHKANFTSTKKTFSCDAVTINKGDFYNVFSELDDNSIDFFDIDIANDGKKFQFFFDNYFKKLSPTGIAILEGGSLERDSIEWMIKYKKQLIRPILKKYKNKADIFVLEPHPSATLIKKRSSL